MGIIRQGILGGLSGKVGNVVGSSWKGISYLRALPSHVTNPNTIGQRTTRTKMSLVIRFLKSCTTLVRMGFSGYAVKMSAFNAATSYNFRNGISGDFPDLGLNYQSLLFSQGNLAGGADVTCVSVEPKKVDFTWTDNSGFSGAQPGDVVLLLVFNPEKGTSVFVVSGFKRDDSAASVSVPANYVGDLVHCYIGFADMARMVGSQQKDFISNSMHVGSVVIV